MLALRPGHLWSGRFSYPREIQLTAPVLEASRDFSAAEPATKTLLRPCVASDDDLICPLSGTNTCPTDPERVKKCPSC